MEWYLEVIKKYAVFNGRARRKEYWMFFLINFIIGTLLGIMDKSISNIGLLGAIYSLAVFIPSMAVTVRRLHDTNRSGWWMLIALVPLIGWIFFFIFTIQDSTPGRNQYGTNPKEEDIEYSNQTPSDLKKCPQCAELVKREARICRFCGHEFYQKPKTVEEEINEFEKKQKKSSTDDFEDDEII